MPFKANAARRHRVPRARNRVTNWPVHEAGLRRRGDLMLWLDQDAIAGWAAPRRSTPGGQPRYSDLAIELVLTRHLVFHLSLRQAEEFTRSVLGLLGFDLRVPDYTTLSRRSRSFAGRQPRVAAGSGAVHLVLDSTGLELFGQGVWCTAKHGRVRRRWLKLHIGVDVTSGEIAAHVLTDSHTDDAAQVPDLLRQPEGAIASLAADGVYDGAPVYQAAAAGKPSPPPDVIIPPRSSAVPSTANPNGQSLRDQLIQLMADHGRMAWQSLTGYGRRNVVEATMARYKRLIGSKLRVRRRDAQAGEVALGVQMLNRMICEAKPVVVRRS